MSREPGQVCAVFLIYSAAITAISLFFLFGQGGADDPDNLLKFWTYIGSGIIFTAALIAIALKRPKDKIHYFTAIIHDPENGLFGKYLKSTGKLILISLIVFTLLGMFGVATNTFAGAPEYQVTETAQIGLASEPAAWSETMLITFLIVFQGGIFLYGMVKIFGFQLNKNSMLASLMIAALLVGFLEFPAYHTLRYGEQEQNLFAVMMLGGGCSILTVATFSIVPCEIWHAEQNAFKKINDLFSNEIGYLIGIIFIIFLILLYYLIYVKIPKSRAAKLPQNAR